MLTLHASLIYHALLSLVATCIILGWLECIVISLDHLKNKLSRAQHLLELFVKLLKEGRNCGFVPSLNKLSIKSLLACYTLEHVLKVG